MNAFRVAALGSSSSDFVSSEQGPSLFFQGHPDKHDDMCDFVNGFHEHFVTGWEENPPPLPKIAEAMIVDIRKDNGGDFDENEEKLAEAVLKVAERAQVNRMVFQDPNKYHNVPHSGHVAISEHFMTKGMSARERLLGILAAFGHDIDHPGTTNKQDHIFEHEQRSFDVVEGIMQECNLDAQDIDTMLLMLLSTSINGGSLYGKLVVEALNAQETPDHEAIKEQVWQALKGPRPDEQKPVFMVALDKMKPLSEITSVDDQRLQHAIVLPMADTFPSLISPVWSAQKLTDENREAGGQMDFNPAVSRAFFVERVIGRRMYEVIKPLQPFLPVFDHFKDRLDNYIMGVDLPKHFLERYLGLEVAA